MDDDMTEVAQMAAAPQCPRCGTRMVPIIYGLPSAELGESAFRGEVMLGGCCIIEGQMPEWGCVPCAEAEAREEDLLWGSDDDSDDVDDSDAAQD